MKESTKEGIARRREAPEYPRTRTLADVMVRGVMMDVGGKVDQRKGY